MSGTMSGAVSGSSTVPATAPVLRVRLAWTLVLLGIGSLELAGSYRGIAAVLVLVAAALVPFAVVRLGQLLRLGTSGGALLAIVLSSAGAWFALRRAGEVSLGGLGDAVPRLLTTARPAPATADLLAPPALLVALVASVVAACVLARPSADRVGGLLAPVVGGVVLYVAGQLLSAGTADPHGLVAIGLLVVVVGGWSLPFVRGGASGAATAVAAGDGAGTAWRPVAVLPVLAVAVLALGVAALTPSAAFDPRTSVTPPTVRLEQGSPLSQLSSWSANPTITILNVRASGTGRLHLATLDTYTGAAWQVDARYQQLGLRQDGDLPAGRARSEATATISVERLAGIWLPAPGVATSTSLDDALIDPDDGTLARPSQVAPGLTYDVTASVNAPSSDQLAVASVPTSVPERYLALPDAPVGFAQYARAAIRGASTPLEEAIALENAVSTNRVLDPRAPTGSSYGRLSTFLFGAKGNAGAQVGTQEQFAASFAVLAREVGLPTRLTVGFLLGTPAANGTVTVRGADAAVWPEIYLGGVGWVPFSPTPGEAASAADSNLRDNVLQRLSEQAKKLPVPDVPPRAVPTAPPSTPRQGTVTDRADARADADGLPLWLVALIGLGALVLLLVIALAALRLLRRRSHRRAGAQGAWAEVLDLLVLIGRRPTADRPAPQIAADVDDVLGPRAATLARAADRAAFAPASPDANATTGHADVPELWADVRRLQRRARSSLPRRRRVFLPIDPRPLLIRRR